MRHFGNPIKKAIKNLFQHGVGHDGNSENRNEKFSSMIEFAPDAFLQGDPGGKIITVNNKVVELTGYSREELLHMNISKLFPVNVLEKKPLRYDLINKGETIKTERGITRKNGEIIEIEMNTNAMPDGTFLTFLREITERKKAEEAIRVSEARLLRAELASKSGNWELHLDTLIIVGSAGASKIYGVAEGNLNYSVIKQVPLPEYRTLMDISLKGLIENNYPYDIEFKIKAIDTGEIKDIHSIAVYDAEKRILFGVIQDITDRKKIEEELIKSKDRAEESDRLKTAFLQNLSHEIRTPMNAIIGFSELMTDTFNDRNKFEKYSEIIKQRSNDLLDIISDILDIAKIESGQLKVSQEECNIPDLFKELETFFIDYGNKLGKDRITFSIHPPSDPQLYSFLSDVVKLKQILINLISNAFKYTYTGSITVGCKLKEAGRLLFYVSDTGIGIPADKKEVIFDRFVRLYQTNDFNPGGNGLGLSIVKGLVDLLGGEIYLETEPGKGSTFSFTVPFKTINRIQAISLYKIEPPVGILSDKTVLIVEDDRYNAEYLQELLSGLGMNTIEVDNGTDAVEVSKTKPIDLVLMDVRLPDINGYDATRQIRIHQPSLIIIAQTAYASIDEKQKAIDAGCNDYLSKPTKKESLITMLNKHLAAVSGK